MKILLVAHGYPPELLGGTELMVQELARGLVARGDEVVVVAGSIDWEAGFRITHSEDRDGQGRAFRVHRIHRADLYFDHWQKSLSARTGRAFRDLLREERPDVVHVHHWIRLTRDLVAIAAREGIPAAVTLHDLWTTCLITFRVPPGTASFCEAELGPDPCLRCAASAPPWTPWVDAVQGRMLLAQYRADIVRELTLARIVATPSRAHAQAVRRFLDIDEGQLERDLVVVPPGHSQTLPRRVTPAGALDAGRLTLVSWGHLNAIKGTDLLLEALALLADPARVTLHLVGSPGTESFGARLQELAQGLDVRFHGPFETPAALAEHPAVNADAMVSGTRAHESWGLVLDEALQLGLPSILPNSGALAERAEGAEWALLYDASNARALADAIEILLADPERLARMGDAVPPTDQVAPSMDAHVEQWRTLYAEAVRLGAPVTPAADWWSERLSEEFEKAWDKSLLQRGPEELGMA